MANAILHIKDSYYFEVPKALWGANYSGVKEDGDAFPDWMIKLDQGFLDWQASYVVGKADGLGLSLDKGHVMEDYHHWLHADHANVGKPLSVFLQSTGAIPAEKLETLLGP